MEPLILAVQAAASTTTGSEFVGTSAGVAIAMAAIELVKYTIARAHNVPINGNKARLEDMRHQSIIDGLHTVAEEIRELRDTIQRVPR